jgi:hypothetical protein
MVFADITNCLSPFLQPTSAAHGLRTSPVVCINEQGLSWSHGNGDWLVHYFLCHYVKLGYSVCLIATNNNFFHYQSIARKLVGDANLCELCDLQQIGL